jgi:hypothetical protein
MRRSRRLTPVVLALAALLAACSVSKDDNAATTAPAQTEVTAPAETSAPDSAPAPDTTEPAVLSRGVTEDTIKIGGAFIDVESVKQQFGVDLGSLPDEMIPALIAGLNADGGINGRQVEYVERLVVPVGTESSDQACRELIEDEQVFAVVGTFLGDTGLCVTETYSTPYFGGFGLTPERQERSKAPFLTTGSNEADFVQESTQLLVDEGLLEGKKIAVYSTADGYSQEFIDTYLMSVLEAAGVEVVASAILSDTGGDQVAAAAELDRILQSFEAAGADTIVAPAGMIGFAPALERTDYAPQLYILNGQIMAADAVTGFAMTNPDELIGAMGVTEGPTSEELLDDPLLGECIDWINANSDLAVVPEDIYPKTEKADSRDFRNLPIICGIFQFMRTVLTAAGDNPSSESIIAGLDSLSSFPVVGYEDASLSAERWGAGGLLRLWEYDPDQVKFVPVP